MKPLIDRISKGPYKGKRLIISVDEYERLSLRFPQPTSNKENAANAELILEAFTVAHETGMTPRQMAERCKLVDHIQDDMVKAMTTAFEKTKKAGRDTIEVTLGPMPPADDDLLPLEPDPLPILPAGLPPLPPGTRYAGQLKDPSDWLAGYVCDPQDETLHWSWDERWGGMNYAPEEPSADWHVAVPI